MIPYVGFGNETLEQLPMIRAGDMIDCPGCGKSHEAHGSGQLLFYQCGARSFIAGIGGRNVVGIKSDIAGDLPE